MNEMNMRGVFVLLLLICLLVPGPVFADASTARQEILEVHAYIQERVDTINDLSQAKKLGEALNMLEGLNQYIESNLESAFYDKVLEARREEPGYVPPALTVVLGEAFTKSFWDARIQQAETSFKNATEALGGASAMRVLDSQDQAFAYLKTAYDTFDSLKSVIEDIATVNFISIAKDFNDGANGFIDNYKAIEEAHLAGLTTELFAQEVKTLARRAEKTLELMKDLKSTLTVYSDDVLRFQYNLKNIENFTTRAVNDRAFPLDFSNTLYNFDISSYMAAMDILEAGFESGEFCWDVFDNLYHKIRREAATEYQQILDNINDSPEPESNKQIYLNDVENNWSSFDGYSVNIYEVYSDARTSALNQYVVLKAALDGKKAERNALITSYWDESGFPQQDLRIFQEDLEGILQVNFPDTASPGPYYLGREYAPSFPLDSLSFSFEMPAKTPDIINYSFAGYGGGLLKLASACRVMAEAGLRTDSTLTYGNGTAVTTVAVSPLNQGLMDDVEYNLYRLRDQALDFATFMKGKQSLIDDAKAKQEELVAAEAALVIYVEDKWRYLCEDRSIIVNDISRDWSAMITPVLINDWTYGDDVDRVVAVVDSHISYIQNQNAFNERIKKADNLIKELQGNATINSLIRFIVTDYDSLPAFPSEEGYRDFLKELNYLHAFYGPADLDRLMDLREEIIALFKQIYGEGLNQWFSTRNSYCLMPEAVGRFQDLLSGIGLWDDRHIEAVRNGFPGWDVWAKARLAEFWPDTNTDNIRPGVTHFTPGRNSESVPLYQVIGINFTEAIDVNTLTDETIRFEAGGSIRPFKVHYDSALNTLLLNPGRMLPGTNYAITLTDGITDLAGNLLVPENWSFSTELVPVGTVPVDIVIGGVEEGSAYADPVTITIATSSGGYKATLSYNGEPAKPIVTGQTVSTRGSYVLTVTADSGLSRTVSFQMGTGSDDYELNIANEVTTADRPDSVISKEYIGMGLRYFVIGERYFYMTGGKIYLYDMLTGENRMLFETGYYYQSAGGTNGEPSTYCSFLGISEDQVLYCKNTGAEAPGMAPEEKTFSLFLYDLSTGKNSLVPSSEGVSLTKGFIKGNNVVWIDSHTGEPAIYKWKKGDAATSTILELHGLEYWQRPELLGFDGDWILYKIGDNNNYVSQDLDDDIYADYRKPIGESLHGINGVTGEAITLVNHDSENPVRIASAGLARGLAAFVAYRMHGEVIGGYWEDTCKESWLSLAHMASGNLMTLSRQPQIGSEFMMSESLLYYVDRNTAPPYSLSGTTYINELQTKVVDLFSYETFAADLGAYYYKYKLFGDRMISADPAARIITFGKPISPAVIVEQNPLANAVDVPLDSSLTIKYSEDMNAESFTSEWIALSRLDGSGNFAERVPFDISYDSDNKTVTLLPSALQSGARYRLYLGGGIEDALGRALVQPRVWYFSTVDETGPFLISSLPPAGSAVMTPGGSINLYFNEKIDQTTADQGIQLLQNGALLFFTTSVNSSDDGLLTIIPSSPLDYNTEYKVAGTSALTDMAGNALQNTFSLYFYTVGKFASNLTGSIVYSDGMGAVSRIEADGSGKSTIAPVSGENVLWSPDGSHIYCVSSDLKVMNNDRSDLVTIATGLPYRFTPDFSPDGSRILYALQHPGTFEYDLVSDDLYGDAPQILYSVPDGTITALSWSPDGKHIAFVWNHGYSVPVELGVLTIDTGQVVFKEDLTNPVWSYDGLRLYAQGKVVESGYKNSLVSLTPDLEDIRMISELPEIAPAELSPTGRFMAFFMSDGIHVADITNGKLTHRLVASAASMGPVRLFWNGDETKLLFNAFNIDGNTNTGIYVLDLADGMVAPVVTVMGGMPSLPMDCHSFDEAGPPMPVSVVVTDLSTPEDTLIHLSWEGYSIPSEFKEFRVYRSEVSISYVTMMTPIAMTTGFVFDDSTAVMGKTYYYAVTAVTSTGKERVAVTPVGPLTSGDNDGLDDTWERRFFGGLSALPSGDADGDGLSNLREMQEYTDPTMADSDGDFASDGIELERGMNPLSFDVTPLTLTAATLEVEVGATLSMKTSGGSGSYSWTVSDSGLADVNEEGVFSAIALGNVEITARDILFPGLISQPLSILVVSERFSLRPSGNITLQRGGNVTIAAVGGSAVHEWELSGDTIAVMEGFGSNRTISSQAESGELQVVVRDVLRSDLDPLTVTITIGDVPGDINGDSRVMLDDAVVVLKVLAGLNIGDRILFSNADVNGDGKIGPEELLYVLKSIATP